MGCDGEDAPVAVFAWDDITYYRCPNQLVTQQSLDYIRWYRHYKNGYMPNTGGLMSQPHKFLQAMEVVDQAIHEYEALLMKKREEEAARQRRRG